MPAGPELLLGQVRRAAPARRGDGKDQEGADRQGHVGARLRVLDDDVLEVDDRVGLGAGLVDQRRGQVGRHAARHPAATADWTVVGGGLQEVAGLVLQHGLAEAGGLGGALGADTDVGDAARGGLAGLHHAGVAAGRELVADTAARSRWSRRPGPFDQAVLVAERKLVKMNVSPEESTRRTGTIVVDGRADARVEGGDGGIVPLGDLALVDLGQDVAAQLEVGDARQVVVDRLGRDHDRDVHAGPGWRTAGRGSGRRPSRPSARCRRWRRRCPFRSRRPPAPG